TAQIWGVTVSHALTRTPGESSDLTGAFYMKNVNNFIFGSTLTSRDRLRELALAYGNRWTHVNSRTFLDVSITQGLGTLFGGMAKGDPLASRLGADDGFTKLNGDVAHVMKVFPGSYVLL